MITVGHLQDPAAACADGEAYGHDAARRTGVDMMQPDLERDELIAIGTEALASIMAHADKLADAGLDRDFVVMWVDAAADAFHAELDRAAALVAAPSASGGRH